MFGWERIFSDNKFGPHLELEHVRLGEVMRLYNITGQDRTELKGCQTAMSRKLITGFIVPRSVLTRHPVDSVSYTATVV